MRKLIAVMVSLLLLISMSVNYSCSKSPDVELSGDEVVTKIQDAMNDLKSYSFNMNVSANATVKREGEFIQSTLRDESNAIIDLEHERAKVEGTSSEVESEDGKTINEEEKVNALYIGDGMVYGGEAAKGEEIDWYSEPVEGELSDIFEYLNRLGLQVDILRHSKVTMLDIEKVEGVKCYALELEPEPYDLFNAMIYQTGLEVMLFENTTPEEMMELVENYTFKQWYAKDTFFLTRVYQYLEMVIANDDMKIELTYEWLWDFDSYNKKFTITVPGVAKEAFFLDPSLGEAVREAAGKPKGQLYKEDLESLAELLIPNTSINDISGLEYCVNLTKLEIWTAAEDISELSSLTKLNVLTLNAYELDDISPLSSLTSLTKLTLGCGELTDITPLSSLTNLATLTLDCDELTDISPLSSLTNLTELTLGRNKIADISPLTSLQKLTTLDLWWNPTADITILASLPKLTQLSLWGWQITDISSLSSLSNVESLALSLRQISNITPLSKLYNLTSLSLTGRQISDITPLSSLTNVKSLSLEVAQTADFSTIASMANLVSLDLSNHDISDVSMLSSITKLTTLDLSSNEITDIAPLSALTALTSLELNSNQIGNISSLSSLGSLQTLHLGNNKIEDISALSSLNNLTTLWLPGNEIDDISCLSSLIRLTELNVVNNNISDISILSAMVNLDRIYLWGNPITDIAPLVENKGLNKGDEVSLDADYLDTFSFSEDMMNVKLLEQRGVVVNLY